MKTSLLLQLIACKFPNMYVFMHVNSLVWVNNQVIQKLFNLEVDDYYTYLFHMMTCDYISTAMLESINFLMPYFVMYRSLRQYGTCISQANCTLTGDDKSSLLDSHEWYEQIFENLSCSKYTFACFLMICIKLALIDPRTFMPLDLVSGN